MNFYQKVAVAFFIYSDSILSAKTEIQKGKLKSRTGTQKKVSRAFKNFTLTILTVVFAIVVGAIVGGINPTKSKFSTLRIAIIYELRKYAFNCNTKHSKRNHISVYIDYGDLI
ncbi:hypothetical protein GQX74_003884 [Glossina fuscipes]|nr:hypothetical protein GQX74_003884 [Glossina fuscipes]